MSFDSFQGQGIAGTFGDGADVFTSAVDAKLAQHGFRLDREAPDFLVSYEAPVDMQGKLSLAVVLASSQRFIWRGTANDNAYPARNLDAREERIRTAVGRLLGQFPPSQSM